MSVYNTVRILIASSIRYSGLPARYMAKGAIINDITQIWTISNFINDVMQVGVSGASTLVTLYEGVGKTHGREGGNFWVKSV